MGVNITKNSTTNLKSNFGVNKEIHPANNLKNNKLANPSVNSKINSKNKTTNKSTYSATNLGRLSNSGIQQTQTVNVQLAVHMSAKRIRIFLSFSCNFALGKVLAHFSFSLLLNTVCFPLLLVN